MNKRKNKGITLTTLVITIVIILILTGTAVYSIRASTGVAPYNNMCSDIVLLKDKILIYYNKYKDIPIVGNATPTQIDEKNYYEIDLTKLENLTINYGTKEDGDNEDVYLVNESLEVYYLKGIEKLGEVYHTYN